MFWKLGFVYPITLWFDLIYMVLLVYDNVVGPIRAIVFDSVIMTDRMVGS